MCGRCLGGPDYHNYLADTASRNPSSLTEKEMNDLFLFDAIRIWEKILRDKVELRRRESMKKEYTV